jgi:hypothetical protein
MEIDNKQYFFNFLKDYIVLERKEHCFTSGTKIIKIEKYFDNGKLLKHDNNNLFGIAFFNAFIDKGAEEIMSAIKNNQDKKEIDLLIEKHTLIQYMPENTLRYKKWLVGDIGNGCLRKNTNEELRFDFVNLSLLNRET